MTFAAKLCPLTLLLWLAACGGEGSKPDPLPQHIDISDVAATNTSSALPNGWHRSGAIMEIFVRSYKDSDGDGFGDLKGITQSLDYLQSLGVKGIWLTPIMPSQTHDHNYEVVDYRAIETEFGTLADFDELIAQAHARGIGVMLDYVMNHSAKQNPLFQNSVSSTQAALRNWYVWSDFKPTGWSVYGNDPWFTAPTGFYYSGFWEEQPEFDFRNSAVIDYHRSNLRFWMNRGVDGFRFDAVGRLIENGATAWNTQPENLEVIRKMRQTVAEFDNRYVVCESPENWRELLPDGECGSAFSFYMNQPIYKAAKGDPSGLQALDEFAKWPVSANAGNFLNVHDLFPGRRVYDELDGDLEAYRLSVATLLTLPGIPFLLYGEEVGMSMVGVSMPNEDMRMRPPMSWTGNPHTAGFTSGTPWRALAANAASFNLESAQQDPSSLYNFYKTLLTLRRDTPALASGSYEHSAIRGAVFSFQRVQGSSRVLVVLNYGSASASATVDGLPPSSNLTPLYPNTATVGNSDTSGTATLTVPARSVAIYRF